MAYDDELTQRFRDCLGGMAGISEKRMMGGVCFLLHGNMLGGADRTKTGERRFMLHVGKENEAEALKRPGAMPVDFSGRHMGGLVFVDAAACDRAALEAWIALALRFVSPLPPK